MNGKPEVTGQRPYRKRLRLPAIDAAKLTISGLTNQSHTSPTHERGGALRVTPGSTTPGYGGRIVALKSAIAQTDTLHKVARVWSNEAFHISVPRGNHDRTHWC